MSELLTIEYARVSTEEQAKEGYSLKAQQEAIKAFYNYKKQNLISRGI